jgi:hypothetical protein
MKQILLKNQPSSETTSKLHLVRVGPSNQGKQKKIITKTSNQLPRKLSDKGDSTLSHTTQIPSLRRDRNTEKAPSHKYYYLD